jgi:hypothetical protein
MLCWKNPILHVDLIDRHGDFLTLEGSWAPLPEPMEATGLLGHQAVAARICFLTRGLVVGR